MKDEFVKNMPFNPTSVKRTNEPFDKTKVTNEQRKAMCVPPILFFFQRQLHGNSVRIYALVLERAAGK